MGEGLEGPGGVARYQLDVISSEVAIAFAESCKVLAEGIGNPPRHSHADHRFPSGLKWDVHVVDLLAQGLGEGVRYIVERDRRRAGQSVGFALVANLSEDFQRHVRDITYVDHSDLTVLERHVNEAVRCDCLGRHHNILHEEVRPDDVVGKAGSLQKPVDLGVLS